MAWCCQATSHCLDQYRPSSLLPYGITMGKCVMFRVGLFIMLFINSITNLVALWYSISSPVVIPNLNAMIMPSLVSYMQPIYHWWSWSDNIDINLNDHQDGCNVGYSSETHLNTLRSRQNGRHLADNTFKCIFLNENVIISIKISLKCVHKGPFDSIPALVQILAWCWTSDKPLSEPMIFYIADAYICHSVSMS